MLALAWFKRRMTPGFFHRFVFVHAQVCGIEYFGRGTAFAGEGDAETDARFTKSLYAKRSIDCFHFFTHDRRVMFLREYCKLIPAEPIAQNMIDVEIRQRLGECSQ